jgi:hypothetical protein
MAAPGCYAGVEGGRDDDHLLAHLLDGVETSKCNFVGEAAMMSVSNRFQSAAKSKEGSETIQPYSPLGLAMKPSRLIAAL